MQAVILAAGKSTRTYPLTLTRPKPLLPLANKPLLAHTLECLKGVVDEAIIIVGYRKEMVKRCFGKSYKGIALRYAWQKEQLGTGHALLTAKPFIKKKFIVMAGDDLYRRNDILKCAKHANAILAAEHPHPNHFGVIKEDKGMLKGIIEKPKKPASNLINTSCYVLEPKIFDILSSIPKSRRGEYELTDAVNAFAKEREVRCVKATQHLAIGYPWDVLRADSSLRKERNAIGKGCIIDGRVINSSIGDHCIIRGTVKNSLIMGNTLIGKGSIIENSVIGSHAMFTGTIRSKKNALSVVNGKSIAAGEFGAAVGDYVTAKNATVGAGCKIWPNKKITGAITHDIT